MEADDPSPDLLAQMGFARFGGAAKDSKRKYNAATDAVTSGSRPPPPPPPTKRTTMSSGKNYHRYHHPTADSSSGSNSLPLGARRLEREPAVERAPAAGAGAGTGADAAGAVAAEEGNFAAASYDVDLYRQQEEHEQEQEQKQQQPRYSNTAAPSAKPVLMGTAGTAAAEEEPEEEPAEADAAREPPVQVTSPSSATAGTTSHRVNTIIPAPATTALRSPATSTLRDGQRVPGSEERAALRRGVRTATGDTAYYDASFVEDPWAQLRREGREGESGR